MNEELNIAGLVPRSRLTGRIDTTFPEVPSTQEEIDVFLQRKQIPQCKTIRKTLFTQPGLLYFAEDISFVYYRLLARNIDYLNSFLNSPHAIQVLTILHSFGSHFWFKEAIEKYASLAGPKRVSVMISPKSDEPYRTLDLIGNCLIYSAMHPVTASEVFQTAKSFENKNWGNLGIDVPLTNFNEIPDKVDEDIAFRQVRNSKEARELGIRLNNCLEYLCMPSNPVWAINVIDETEGEIPIGAFQVSKLENGRYRLIQVHAARNSKLPRRAVISLHRYLDEYMPHWRERQFHQSLFDRWLEEIAGGYPGEMPNPILDEHI